MSALERSTKDDDSWYTGADCPKFFDFSGALQAPCPTDVLQNPPLHDFVYESDEESRRFFSKSHSSPESPQAKRPQQRMLDPRHFGDPTYRHRPETTFEEFLQEYEESRIRHRRRSLHTSRSVETEAPQESQRSFGSSAFKECSVQNRPRPESLKVRGNRTPQRARDTGCSENLDEEDRTVDLLTPTLDSILTPVTSRRTCRQLTPARTQNSSVLAKSLFSSKMMTPSASPVRKTRPLSRPLRLNKSNTDGSGSSSQEVALAPAKSTPLRPTTPSRHIPLRPPERITPPTGRSETSLSLTIPAPSKYGRSKSCLARPTAPSPDTRKARPLRAERPAMQEEIVESTLPSTQKDGPRGSRKDRSTSLRSVLFPRNDRTEPGHEQIRLNAISGVHLVNDINGEILTNLPASRGNPQREVGMQDPTLARVVYEHNRKLRSSSRITSSNPVELCRDPDHQRPRPHSARFPAPRRGISAGTNLAAANTREKRLESGNFRVMANDTDSANTGRRLPSLSDLLQSENDRILRQRNERLQERQKEFQENKENMLRSMETQHPEQRRFRALATVELTATSATERKPSGLVGVQGEGNSNEPTRKQGQKGIQAFRARVKKVGASQPNPASQRAQKPSVSRGAVPRVGTVKTSVSDKIKASARQRVQEKRLESDLNSMLSQHNNRIQGSKRGRV